MIRKQPQRTYTEPEYPVDNGFRNVASSGHENVVGVCKAGRAAACALLALSLGGCVMNKPTKYGVAPLFQHGRGYGSIGGMGVFGNFMTEEEGRKIIVEEFKKQGIVFDKTNIHPKGLKADKWDEKETFDQAAFHAAEKSGKLPSSYGEGILGREEEDVNSSVESFGADQDVVKSEMHFYSINDPFTKITLKKTGSNDVYFDLYSTSDNLAVEFVTTDDYIPLGGIKSSSTLQPYNLKAIAELLRRKMLRRGGMNAVVFYDPIYMMTDNDYAQLEKIPSNGDGMSKRREIFDRKAAGLLRQQIADFLAWRKNRLSKGKAK